MSNLLIRTLRPSDPEMAFVNSSWLRSYNENRLGPPMNYGVYRDAHTRFMQSLANRSEVRAVQFEDVDEVLGYALVENDVCHFVYVKSPYRRQHLATALLRDVTTYSTYTKAGGKLAKALKLSYNPYTIYPHSENA